MSVQQLEPIIATQFFPKESPTCAIKQPLEEGGWKRPGGSSELAAPLFTCCPRPEESLNCGVVRSHIRDTIDMCVASHGGIPTSASDGYYGRTMDIDTYYVKRIASSEDRFCSSSCRLLLCGGEPTRKLSRVWNGVSNLVSPCLHPQDGYIVQDTGHKTQDTGQKAMQQQRNPGQDVPSQAGTGTKPRCRSAKLHSDTRRQGSRPCKPGCKVLGTRTATRKEKITRGNRAILHACVRHAREISLSRTYSLPSRQVAFGPFSHPRALPTDAQGPARRAPGLIAWSDQGTARCIVK